MRDHLTVQRALSSAKCPKQIERTMSVGQRAARAVGCAITFAALLVPATAHASEGDLLSHRAVYELSLNRADRDSGVDDAAGAFVFQVRGSSCSGWNIVSDIVLSIQNEQGGTIRTETQYRAFEDAVGEIFTFQSETRTEGSDDEMVTGAAERRPDGSVSIRRFASAEERNTASRQTRFPNQLTVAMLDAAQSGERILFSEVFDGSHESGVAQPASVVIGSAVAPTVIAPVGASQSSLEGDVEEDHWADFPLPEAAWPVTLSYFDPREPDSPPNFRVSYTLDTNGVSDSLILDYGSFSLRGKLVDFTAFLPAECDR